MISPTTSLKGVISLFIIIWPIRVATHLPSPNAKYYGRCLIIAIKWQRNTIWCYLESFSDNLIVTFLVLISSKPNIQIYKGTKLDKKVVKKIFFFFLLANNFISKWAVWSNECNNHQIYLFLERSLILSPQPN